MLRTIYWFTGFWVYQLASLFLGIKYKSLGKKDKKLQQEFLGQATKKWARTMIKMTGSQVEVQGLENVPEETVLFVSNHQGNFDIPTLMGYLPKSKGFVAKIELEKLPIVSKWMKRIGCIFLDRSDPRQSLKTILKGVELLKSGHSMVIFPEGTRSKGKAMGEFKKGSLKLATKSKVKIVPVTINGTYTLLEEKKRITKSKVLIKIHEPIDTVNYNQKEQGDLTEKVYHIIQSGIE